MAERKFDYNNVSTVYQNMKKITGDASDGESIAGILHKIDEEVHDKVDVCEEAIFGDLGKQMLLDWDNTSANFDNFVTNFSNWSTLIAQSAGNYAQFEQDIAGFKQANPLGVTSGGITDAYTNTGYYANSYSSDEIKELEDLAVFYDLTGATYIDTGMVEFAKKNKTYRIANFALNVISIAGFAFSGAKIVTSGAKFLTTAKNGMKPLTSLKGLAANAAKGLKGIPKAIKYSKTFAKLLLVGGKTSSKIATGFWNSIRTGAKSVALVSATGASLGVISDITYAIGSDYDLSKYGTGYQNANMFTGQAFSVDNKDYIFLGSTSQGTNIFTDENDNVYYLDSSGNMKNATITDSSGNEKNATLNDTANEFEMRLGDEVVTENDSLSSGISYNLREYNDNLDSSYESTFVDSTVNQDEKLEDNLGTN